MKRSRTPVSDERKRLFRETARDILLTAKVKRQFGEAVDTAGAIAQAMQQAYRLGFDDAVDQAVGSSPPSTESTEGAPLGPAEAAMEWARIPPRTRSTFWSICLAALGRDRRTSTPSYIKMMQKQNGSIAWQLVVPDRLAYERAVGDGTIVTLVRLGLLQHARTEDPQVTLTDYGIRTWNRFLERGGQWSEDLVEKL